jgi:DNA-binding NarL/FixJ family response regulator
MAKMEKSHHRPFHKGKRITMPSVLIIENNDFFRRSFKEILKLYIPSLIIDESADGSDVLDKIQRNRPDVVFMDIQLPGKNGLELTREIKYAHPDVAVSIFTNYDIPEYRSIAEDCGADYFLLKDTVSGAEIAAMVRCIAAKNASLGNVNVTGRCLPQPEFRITVN